MKPKNTKYIYRSVDSKGNVVESNTSSEAANLYQSDAPGLDGMDVTTYVDEDGTPHFSARQKDEKRL